MLTKHIVGSLQIHAERMMDSPYMLYGFAPRCFQSSHNGP